MVLEEAVATLRKAGFSADIQPRLMTFTSAFIRGGIPGKPMPGLPEYITDWFNIGPRGNVWILNYSSHTATNREEQDNEIPIEHQVPSLQAAVDLIIQLRLQGRYPHKSKE